MMNTVWINERLIEADEATIPLGDAGLLYAAGVFTTMRSFGGSVYRLNDHLQRVRASSQALFIPLQYSDEVLAAGIDDLLRRNELADARLRLTITRGTSTQDPLHGQHLFPNVFISATATTPYPAEFYQKGVTVTLVDEQKLNPYDIQAGHKTLNYFSRLAALRNANKIGAAEALWFNVHNYLQSGSITNVFVVKDGRLHTPPTQAELADPKLAAIIPYPRSNVLPGITRKAVIELAANAGISTVLSALTVQHLLAADEVFITNSNMLLMPVARIERKELPQAPGPITQKLAEMLDDEINSR